MFINHANQQTIRCLQELEKWNRISKHHCPGILNSFTQLSFLAQEPEGTERKGSDIDIRIIPKPGIEASLKDRISLENSVPENVDVSLFDDLPVNIRNSVLHGG